MATNFSEWKFWKLSWLFNLLSKTFSLSLSLLFYFHNAVNLPSTRKSHLARPQIQYRRHWGLNKNRRECSGRWKGQGSSPSGITVKSVVSLPEDIHRETAKDPKNTKRPVKKGFTLIAWEETEKNEIKSRNWGCFRKIHSLHNRINDLSIIYKLIDKKSLW